MSDPRAGRDGLQFYRTPCRGKPSAIVTLMLFAPLANRVGGEVAIEREVD
ncbi:MAG: hypothetical protein ABUL62_21980 [Myxococcales bacterium]